MNVSNLPFHDQRAAGTGSIDLTLDQISRGSVARILDVTGDDSLAIRLMEMGLIEGEEIELIGAAPLGDPLEFAVRGYRLSLRAGEAKRVVVEPVAGSEP